jgi:predicted nucleic acid-binding protein
MLFALDSNVVLYSEGVNDTERQILALRLIEAAGIPNIIVPIQALGETFNRLTKRNYMSREAALGVVKPWFHGVKLQETTAQIFDAALDLASAHQFRIWDAVILSAASASGASILFSEDMQDGFQWRDVTILNPFASLPNPIVQKLLRSSTH